MMKRSRESASIGLQTEGETDLNSSTSIIPKQPCAFCLGTAAGIEDQPFKKQASSAPNSHNIDNHLSHNLGFARSYQANIVVGTDNPNARTNEVGDVLGNESCPELSVSHHSEDLESLYAIDPDSFVIPGSILDFFDHPSVDESEAFGRGLEVSTGNAVTGAAVASETGTLSPSVHERSESILETKTKKKDDPYRFPPNVRSLLSTGVFDGVPVKYMSTLGPKLRGIIKDQGFLCGCQTCNFSKVINAYEFESHAGCNTKHPNNRIQFENGKTLYGIVLELRRTPENLLFEKIQTVSGSDINQKSFSLWKESFQAATRELERIDSAYKKRREKEC